MRATHVEPAISAQGLSKSLGGRPVIRGLNLTLHTGETLAVIGHNGSGKTTLIRLLAGLTRASAGAIYISGLSQRPSATVLQRSIGVASHNTFLYRDLTVLENLSFYGRLYDVSDLNARIESLVKQFRLAGYRNTPVRALSRGTQQRLSIARALLPDPALVLLDEPDSGLDPQGIEMLPDLLALAASDAHTTLLTTHNLELGLKVADRVAILARGRLVWEREAAALTLPQLRDAYNDHLPRRDGTKASDRR